MSRVRIISSADYGPVFPMELKVYRDLEKYFDEQKRKERRAKKHGTYLKVKPYQNNPRNNDDAVEATANSIQQFGWQQPIVVDKNGVIIIGGSNPPGSIDLN